MSKNNGSRRQGTMQNVAVAVVGYDGAASGSYIDVLTQIRNGLSVRGLGESSVVPETVQPVRGMEGIIRTLKRQAPELFVGTKAAQDRAEYVARRLMEGAKPGSDVYVAVCKTLSCAYQSLDAATWQAIEQHEGWRQLPLVG